MLPEPDRAAPARLRLLRVRVPLLRTHSSAHGSEPVRDVVLVEWTRPDGVTGWGECPTLSTEGYVTGTTERAWQALTLELAPAAIEGRTAVGGAVVAAAASLLDAALDAALRAEGRSLRAALGGRAGAVPRTAVLADPGAGPTVLAARAAEAVAAGARMVKVKIRPGQDVELLHAVAAEVGAARTAADANGAYGHPSELAGVDRLGLAYLEQPFAPGRTWEELASLHSGLETPVALDESLTSPDAVRSALLAGAAQVVSVKPARLGGIRAARLAVELAEEHGRAAFVGGMLELGVGRAGSAALATLAGCTLPTDLGPSSAYVAQDVVEPIVVDGEGDLVVPDGPGIGRTPEPAGLAEVTVDEVVLGA